jgi:uncharacterized protein (DUF697 family)
MLKGMDPEGLSEMMKQSGMNVTPQQARSMVDKLDGVSGGWVGAVGVECGAGHGCPSCLHF